MIQFENVSKKYQNSDTEVVKNINLTIPTGQIAVIIGPSGCGKTTCLKMINRLIKITGGRILIDGKDIMDYDVIKLRRSMGYVIQQTGLFPHMTVRENIEIIPTLEKRDKEKTSRRTKELMRMIGLDPEEFLDRYPTQLSGGQLQRVGVARAFATDPDIILMDEPFSALDPITRGQLQDELIFLQEKLKKTIVFVTHDMDEAIKLGNMICILKDGEIVQYDTPEQIMKKPATEYVREFVGRNRIWDNPEYIHAEDIMITQPLTVPGNLPALQTLEQMRIHQVNGAMVLNREGVFLGFVTALDIQRTEDKNTPVHKIARQAKVTAAPGDSIVKLLDMVNKNKTSLIPVLGEGEQLLGLITSSSLVTTLSRQYINYEEV